MKITILHNQSLLDLAIQHTGSVENAFELAVENGLSLTDDLEAGESIKLTTHGIRQNKDILGYYQAKKLQPATGINYQSSTINDKPQGIDYWTVQIDFVVS